MNGKSKFGPNLTQLLVVQVNTGSQGLEVAGSIPTPVQSDVQLIHIPDYLVALLLFECTVTDTLTPEAR